MKLFADIKPREGQRCTIFSIATQAQQEVFEAAVKAHDLKITKLQGCYKNVLETSYIMTNRDLFELPAIELVNAVLMDQESVLEVATVAGITRAGLVFPATGVRIDLGFLNKVPRHIAMFQDAWTRCDDEFYTCQPETNAYGEAAS